jgi:hypothetical protein
MTWHQSDTTTLLSSILVDDVSGSDDQEELETYDNQESKVEFKLVPVGLSFEPMYKMRASNLATVVDGVDTNPDDYRSRCPVPRYNARFKANCKYGILMEHANQHESTLFAMGLNTCPFTCPVELLDGVQLQAHLRRCKRVPRAQDPDDYHVNF